MMKREWVASGFLAGSHVTGSPGSIASTQLNSTRYYQRPQADYIEFDPTRTSLDGHIGEVAIARNGSLFRSLAYKEASPGLELNDMGFIGRADYRATSALVGYQDVTAGKRLRNFSYYGYANQTYNFGGLSILRSGAGGLNMTFLNLWTLSINAGANPRYSSDRFTGADPMRSSHQAGTAASTWDPIAANPSSMAVDSTTLPPNQVDISRVDI